MERLGGWRRERVIGRAGLTLAGLLMFGSERSLLDALPHYHLDYQEQLSADPEERWSHRITVDGKWVSEPVQLLLPRVPASGRRAGRAARQSS